MRLDARSFSQCNLAYLLRLLGRPHRGRELYFRQLPKLLIVFHFEIYVLRCLAGTAVLLLLLPQFLETISNNYEVVN